MRPLPILLVLLATCATAAAADPVWPDCTVEMADGTLHEHVDVAWKLEGFMIQLVAVDGTETNLSPYSVAGVLDTSGRDITQEVADANPTDTHYALLGDRRIVPLVLGLSADAGGSGGLTSGYGGFKTAGAWFAGARWGFAERFHARAQYRWQQVREDVPGFGIVMGTETNEVAVLLGYRLVHPRRNRNYTYLEAGPVLVHWNQRWNGESGTTVAGGDPAVGFLLRGGVLLRVADHLGIDVGALFSLRPSLAIDADDPGIVVGLNLALAVF